MSGSSPVRRGAVLAVIVGLLVGACGGATGPSGPSGPAAGSSDPGRSAAPSTGAPGASVAPSGSSVPAVTPPPPLDIPQPSLTDPYDIGAALRDPATVPDAIASLLDQLGVGIYAADGTPIRPGRERGPLDPWLFEDEVRGLIAMGVEDAAAGAAGSTPQATLGDLAGPLAELSGATVDEILAAYDEAYTWSDPQPLIGQVAPLTFVEDEPVNRAVLWFLLLDGVVGTERSTADLGVAALVPVPPARRAAPSVDLPTIPSPVPGLTIEEFALLLTHLGLLGFQVGFEADPASITAHEGHAGTGTPVELGARVRPSPTQLVSPLGGRVLIAPRPITGLGGLAVTWHDDSGLLGGHGTPSPAFGTPTTTDATGVARLAFEPRPEEVNGQGDLDSDTGLVTARIAIRDLVLALYDLPPVVWPLLSGDRIAYAVATVEFHAQALEPGQWEVVLSGPQAGSGSYRGTTEDFYCSAPLVDGVRHLAATVRPASGPIRLIDVLSDSGAGASVGVTTEYAWDNPVDWFVQGSFPGTSVAIRMDLEHEPPTLDVDASWIREDGSIFITARLACPSVLGL
jgi:hypothetical protein